VRTSRETTETERRLRVSLVVGSPVVPAWIAALADRLTTSPRFELLLYVDDSAPPAVRPSAFRLYERADAWLFRQPRDALAPVALPRSQIQPLPALDDCDVVVDLGSREPEAFSSASRCGVWTLSHDDIDEARPNVPPLFWQMYRRELYRTRLEARLGDGDRHVLYTSHGRPNRTSLHRSRNQAYWKAHGAIARALDALYERGPSYVTSRPRAEATRSGVGEDSPSGVTVARHVASLSVGIVGRRLRKLAYNEQWFVAARVARAGSLVDRRPLDVDGFRPVTAARGEHYADPFVFEDGGDVYVFFERFDERARRASIAFTRLDTGANALAPPESVLRRDYHVSYPFLFRHGHDIFMIPESLERQAVDLYRAVDFPAQWVLEDCLLDGVCAVDATLLEEGSRLWLFVGVAEPGASVNDELHLYSSTTLAGPWAPHPENPIVSDVRSARPAGRIFHHHGHLIRPAQDCSRGYGTAVVLNRIDVLTTAAYAESPVGRIEPNWAPRIVGTHTYNSTGDIEVVDGRRFEPRFRRRRLEARPGGAGTSDEQPGVVLQQTTFEAAREDWARLAARGTNVFATWEWASTWWRHFERNRQPLLVSCRRHDGEVLALLPLYGSQRGGLRIVRLIGHGPADELAPLCAPEDRPTVAAALRSVLGDARADVFIGDELPRAEGWSRQLGAVVRGTGSSPVVNLGGQTWDDFLHARSHNFRQQLRRRERSLTKQGLRFRLCENGDRLPRELDTLFALHRLRWAGARTDFGRLEAFHRDFAVRAFEQGWLRLWFLEVNGRDVAAWYGLRFGNVDSYYQAGRDPAWDGYAVGSVLLAHSVREAIQDGMNEYRLGRGAERYKSRFADHDAELETVVLVRGLKGRLAVAAAEAIPRKTRARRYLRSTLDT
jgi:CelD/BcsL family acetyltransferase involved in cellulose biosynthesis